MSVINMNIIFFIIILVSTSLFSVATAVDGYIFKSDAEFFHKLLLTNGTTKTNEFSFTFCRDPACNAATRSSLKISFGSAKSGSSLVSFKLDVVDVSGQGVATVTSMDDSSIATTAIPPNTSPSEKSTHQPVETTNTVLPEKSTSKTITQSESIRISSTVMYVIDKVVTFLMVILVSASTSYFVFSRFSNSKPPEDANTKIDAEETKTKVTTIQYNIHNYFPNIKTIIHKKKNIFQNKGDNIGCNMGDKIKRNSNKNLTVNKQQPKRISNRQSIGTITGDVVQVAPQFGEGKMKNNQNPKYNKSVSTV